MLCAGIVEYPQPIGWAVEHLRVRASQTRQEPASYLKTLHA